VPPLHWRSEPPSPLIRLFANLLINLGTVTLGPGFFLPGMIVSSYLILVWLDCGYADLLVEESAAAPQ
jgi:hypothetical protein